MINAPHTVIELYDKDQIHNVLAACVFQPKELVFIGGRTMMNKKIRENILTCIRKMGLDVSCSFRAADMLDVADVKAKFEAVIAEFPSCAVDITGGSDVALVAAGMLAHEGKLSLFRYDRFANAYRDIHNAGFAEGVTADPRFNIDAILALSGAVMKSHGHVAVGELDKETLADIFKVWTVYKRSPKAWHRAVAYLQQISKDLGPDELSVSASAMVYSGERLIGEENKVMTALSERGIIKNYTNDGRRVRFTYKNTLMRSCLCDIGICLELYVYAAAKSAGCYSDTEISVVIDWDGDLDARINTINEIDVVVVNGFVPIFISCKSGTPNVTALNEIQTLTRRFGGEYARAVLVTMADVRTRDRYLYRRAMDMGIEIIDREDLVAERLSKRLYSISKI